MFVNWVLLMLRWARRGIIAGFVMAMVGTTTAWFFRKDLLTAFYRTDMAYWHARLDEEDVEDRWIGFHICKRVFGWPHKRFFALGPFGRWFWDLTELHNLGFITDEELTLDRCLTKDDLRMLDGVPEVPPNGKRWTLRTYCYLAVVPARDGSCTRILVSDTVDGIAEWRTFVEQFNARQHRAARAE
jgi:hypothetical protein